MKKGLRVLSTALLLGAMAGLASCGNTDTVKPTDTIVTPAPEDTLTSISVTGAKATFVVKNEFVTTGLVVTATYSISGNKVLAATDYTVDSSAVNTEEAGTYTITVSYEGKQATYDVTYVDATLESISLEGTDNQSVGYGKDYTDSKYREGVKVFAHFDNGQVLDITSEALFDLDTTVVGENICTVTYQTKTLSYSVVVEEPLMTRVDIDVQGTDDFNTGDEFNTKNLVVTATYEDASITTLTSEDYSIKIYKELNSDGTPKGDEVSKEEFKEQTGRNHYYVFAYSTEDETKFASYGIVQDAERRYLSYSATVSADNLGEVKENTVLATWATGSSVTLMGNSTSSKNISIDANGKSWDGVTYTHRIKLTGSAIGTDQEAIVDNISSNAVKIHAEHRGTLTLVVLSSNSAAGRTVCLLGDSYSEKHDINAAGSAITENDVITFTIPEAGDYYIYSQSSGINIYDIKFNEEIYVSEVTYTSMTIDTTNVKLSYKTTDVFDPTGLVVKALNSFGVEDVIDITKLSFKTLGGAAVDLSIPADKYKITVVFGDLQLNYYISIEAEDAIPTEISQKKENSITTVYTKGSELDISNLEVEVHTHSAIQNESYTKYVTIDELTYKVYNGNEDVTASFSDLDKGTYTLTVYYTENGVTVSFNINVYICEVNAQMSSYINNSVLKPFYLEGSSELETLAGAKFSVLYDSGVEDKTITKIVSTGVSAKYYSKSGEEYTPITYTEMLTTAGTYYAKYSCLIDGKTIESADYTDIMIGGTSYYSKFAFDSLTANCTSGQVLDEEQKVTAIGKVSLDTANPAGGNSLKLDSCSDVTVGKCVCLDLSEQAKVYTVVLVLNSSGDNKVVSIADSTGTVVTTATVSKTVDGNLYFIFTITTPDKYYVYSKDGGARLVGGYIYADAQ